MRWLSLTSLLALGACTMGPNYTPPDIHPEPHYAQTSSLPPVQATTPWWESFHDATLDRLVAMARQANPDVQQAMAAAAAARAEVIQAEAGGMPQLTGTLGATDTREFTPPDYVAIGYGSVGIDASWELDLWGKRRRTVEAAKDNADAARANQDAAMLTLLGDLTKAYVALRGAQAQLVQNAVALHTAWVASRLTQERQAGGDGTMLETAQAEAELHAVEAERPPLEAQVQLAIHLLSTLCGQNPQALETLLELKGQLPRIDPPGLGVPADLLRRRPDVRVAERQLAQDTAEIGVAVAAQYPTLTLQGSIGLSGNMLAKMFAMPLYALGPSINAPIFDAGAKAAGVDIARAKVGQAYQAYRGTVLKAAREVEDALSQVQSTTEARVSLEHEVSSAEQAEKAALALYTLGGTSFLDVLDAQRSLNRARMDLTTNQVTLDDQMVALYRALGGGYDAL
jgi:outer membrane protein, multidrug efflux system